MNSKKLKEYKGERNRVVPTALGILAVLGIALILSLTPRANPRSVEVQFDGTTHVPNGGKIGWGTMEFPNFDLSTLTNSQQEWTIGLFRITNGFRNGALISFQWIELWNENHWAPYIATNEPTAFFSPPPLERGKITIVPISEPKTDRPWRLRLGVQEFHCGLRAQFDQFTAKHWNRIFFPGGFYRISSPAVHRGRQESDVERMGRDASGVLESDPSP